MPGPQLKGGGHGGQRYMQEQSNYLAMVAGFAKVCGACARCTEIIESKKAMGKYRPMKVPAKCAGCGAKNVTQAYATYCAACSGTRRICMRCGDAKKTGPARERSAEETAVANEVAALQAKLKEGGLKEREYRTVVRKLERALEAKRTVAKAVRERAVVSEPTEAEASSGSDLTDSDDDGKPIGKPSFTRASKAAQNAAEACAGAAPGVEAAPAVAPLTFVADQPPLDFSFGFASLGLSELPAKLPAPPLLGEPPFGPQPLGMSPPGASSKPSAPPAAVPAAVPANSAAAVPAAAAAVLVEAAPAAAATRAPMILEELSSVAAVDAAFGAVWQLLLPLVTPAHAEKAEEAFDAIGAALKESEADRMSDAAAAATDQFVREVEAAEESHTQAIGALVMLREALRWRASIVASTASGVGQGGEGTLAPAEAAALAAAEAAARLVHQLVTMAKAWAVFNTRRWQDGKMV